MGRGPIQLSHNYNYGSFSLSAFDDMHKLLKDPQSVATDGYLSFLAGIWFYMNPQSPKPSMHEVAVELWKPNDKDKASGFHLGFGATTNIINGGLECGHENAKANTRVAYFKEWIKRFGIQNDYWAEDNLK